MRFINYKFIIIFFIFFPLSSQANTVDILFLYDSSAEKILTQNNQGARPSTVIRNWSQSINSFLNQSQVNFRITYLGAEQFQGPRHYGQHPVTFLNELENATRNLAKQHGADYIQFITGDQSQIVRSCSGYAQIQGTVSVVSPKCGARISLHEIGHNWGLRHSEKQDGAQARNSAGPGNKMQMIARDAFGYGGYGNFVSIMAYPSAFGVGENAQGALNTFSNPNIKYRGSPTGINGQANSVRVLNQYSTRYINVMASKQSSGDSTDGGNNTNNQSNGNSDNNQYCSYWTQKGYCTSSQYKSYMQKTCSKSCNSSQSSSNGSNTRLTDNSSYRSQCPAWAARGYCLGRYESFMKSNCALSCSR